MSPPDPLASPVTATLFFGGVFLAAFLVSAVRYLLHLRPGPDAPGEDPGAGAMVLGWLAFAVGSGVAVAWARRRFDRTERRNRATGVIVGLVYAVACATTFGRTLAFGPAAIALFVGVWAGVAYAVASGLAEALPDRPPPR